MTPLVVEVTLLAVMMPEVVTVWPVNGEANSSPWISKIECVTCALAALAVNAAPARNAPSFMENAFMPSEVWW